MTETRGPGNSEGVKDETVSQQRLTPEWREAFIARGDALLVTTARLDRMDWPTRDLLYTRIYMPPLEDRT